MSEATTPTMTGSEHDAEQLKKKAAEVGHAVADLASEARYFASSKLGQSKEHLSHKYEQSKQSVHDYVVREPYKALAIAAGVGFVLGMLLKRK